MTSKNKSWVEKYEVDRDSFEKIHDSTKGAMYISSPKEINSIIKQIPEGKLITTKMITDKLTNKNKVVFTCPLTTGIFLSIIANKTEEERTNGIKDLTPYWRVVRPNGDIYDKYLGQTSHQLDYIEREGIEVEVKKNKKGYKVKDMEKYLVK
jgi:alkylated DNA nucleotide flippase Atl1